MRVLTPATFKDAKPGEVLIIEHGEDIMSIKKGLRNHKDTNPKDAVGMKKVPMSVVSGPVMMSVGLAMLEGARKYGRHNYRVSGVRASVYYDAAMRHLMAWWEGEDTDPDSGLSHIIKAIASLMVLADADMSEKVIDDRPPKCNDGWIKELNIKAEEVIERYPDALEAYTESGEKDWKHIQS